MKQRKSMKNITTGPHNCYSAVQGRPDCWKRNNQEVEVNIGNTNPPGRTEDENEGEELPQGGRSRNASPGLEVPEAPLHVCQVPREVGRQLCSWPT